MSTVKYSPEQLTNLAKLTPEDMAEINQRRHLHNRLGFAYQLAYVRLSGAHWAQFPAQVAFVTLDELLTFVSVQLNLATEAIADYATPNPMFKSTSWLRVTFRSGGLQAPYSGFLFHCLWKPDPTMMRLSASIWRKRHSLI